MDEKLNEFRDVPSYPGLQVRGDGKAVRAVKSSSGSVQKVQYYNYTIKQDYFGRTYVKRRQKGEEEILYVGKHTYISSGIYRYLGYWFYIFEINRKMENKRVKEKCKGVIND